jgi:beta-glucosidase
MRRQDSRKDITTPHIGYGATSTRVSLAEPLEGRRLFDAQIVSLAVLPRSVVCYAAAPSSPPPVEIQPRLSGLVLVDVATETDIDPLANGSTIDLSVPGTLVNVRAEVIDEALVGSVRWSLDDEVLRVENAAPFAVGGDIDGQLVPWSIPVGKHTLTATPYAGDDATGFAGETISATFTVKGQATPTPTPIATPTDSNDPSASVQRTPDRHQEFLARIKQGPADLLFLGDSITDYWRTTGKGVFDANYALDRPANFGVGGDKTQNVIWRITHGELDGISPKVVVLMIGTNNLAEATDAKIAAGIKKIVAIIREKLPDSKVLLLGILPRGAADEPRRARIKNINGMIDDLDDGGQHVKFLDIGPRFLRADGSIGTDMMADLLHPTAKGYQIWADAMRSTLLSLM